MQSWPHAYYRRSQRRLAESDSKWWCQRTNAAEIDAVESCVRTFDALIARRSVPLSDAPARHAEGLDFEQSFCDWALDESRDQGRTQSEQRDRDRSAALELHFQSSRSELKRVTVSGGSQVVEDLYVVELVYRRHERSHPLVRCNQQTFVRWVSQHDVDHRTKRPAIPDPHDDSVPARKSTARN